MPRLVFTEAYKTFLNVLIAARKDAGITQAELGKKLGWLQSSVSQMENGIRRLDIIEFCAVAKAIGREGPELLNDVLQKLPDDFDK